MNKWADYEQIKAKLEDLTPEEYEKAIKKLTREDI
jgi:predicted Zn-dependent peptidase